MSARPETPREALTRFGDAENLVNSARRALVDALAAVERTGSLGDVSRAELRRMARRDLVQGLDLLGRAHDELDHLHTYLLRAQG